MPVEIISGRDAPADAPDIHASLDAMLTGALVQAAFVHNRTQPYRIRPGHMNVPE